MAGEPTIAEVLPGAGPLSGGAQMARSTWFKAQQPST
jgi:hypothetical protein